MMSRRGKYYVCFYLDGGLSFSPRHTKPLPESVFQLVEEGLFEGDLTEEEETDRYCILCCLSMSLIVFPVIPKGGLGGVAQGG
jgi:hypothetical protein